MSQYREFESLSHAELYAATRPIPPLQLIQRILNFLQEEIKGPLHSAIDVGCGTGQMTHLLAPHFESVSGLDVSPAMIDQAQKCFSNQNLSFIVSPAEDLPFEDESVQLITSNQACHWFDIPKFFEEADRVLVPNGVISLTYCTEAQPVLGESSGVLQEFFFQVLTEVRKNTAIKFNNNFELFSSKNFDIPYTGFLREISTATEKMMTVRELFKSVESQSGYQRYKEQHGEEASKTFINERMEQFLKLAGVTTSPDDTIMSVKFQYYLIIGRKPKKE